MPSFVFFDLDDTLLDHHAAQRQALADIYNSHLSPSRLSLETIRDTYHRINIDYWHRYRSRLIGKDEVRLGRFRTLAESIGLDVDPTTVSHAYMKAYANHWRYFDGAELVLEHTSARFPMGIITNGFADVQRNKLKRFPLIANCSSCSIISEDVGVLKPDPRIFEEARRNSGFEPGQIMYVGDSFKSDVVGALDAGWQAVWFNPHKRTPPNPDAFGYREVHTWEDFLGLIG